MIVSGPSAEPPEIGATALGRLLLRVTRPDGVDDVTIERRCPTPALARAWIEKVVRESATDTEVLELYVIAERWRRSLSWQTLKSGPETETVQVGAVLNDGSLVWSSSHAASPSMGARHQR